MRKSATKKYSFLNWYVPICLAVLLFSAYIYGLGFVPSGLGLGRVSNTVLLKPANLYASYRDWFLFQGRPGEMLEESLYFKNFDDKTKDFAIYTNDANGWLEEDFQFISAQEVVGKWIQLPYESVTLKPFEELIIPIKLEIPENTEHGKYSGAVVVNEIEKEEEIIVEDGIRLDAAIGARVFVEVTDSPVPRDLLRAWDDLKSLRKKTFLLHTALLVFNAVFLAALFAYGVSGSKSKPSS